MKTRWRVLNCRHQYFEIEDTAGRWKKVGRIDSGTGQFVCCSCIPRLRVIGFRARLPDAKKFTRSTVLKLLHADLRWWFKRVLEKSRRRVRR